MTKVDPAAALVAVLAVAFTVMNEEGPWGWLSTGTAIVVLVLLWAFLWPAYRPHTRPAVGAALTAGVVAGMGLAWPAQYFLSRVTRREIEQVGESAWSNDDLIEKGFLLGLALGLVLAAAVVLPLLLSMPRDEQRSASPLPVDSDMPVPVPRDWTCPRSARGLLLALVLLIGVRRWSRL